MTVLNSASRAFFFSILLLGSLTSAQPDDEPAGQDMETAACSRELAVNTLCKCQIMDLHPTQFTVGMIAVKQKRDDLIEMTAEKLKSYKKKHAEPVVVDPSGAYFIIDHHHLALALLEAGEESTYCEISATTYGQTKIDFWSMMKERGWVYPYERERGPLPYANLPTDVTRLTDDPYRSLVKQVRDAGDIDKSELPFFEFQWADYFRPLITEADLATDFDKAVKRACKLAHSPAASRLPGYREN